MSTVKNNAVIVDTCTQRIAALKKHFAAKTQISMSGDEHSVAELIKIYQACLDTRAALIAARGTVKTALAERQAAEKARLAIEQGLKAWVLTKFKPTNAVVHELGYAAKKVAKVDVETKANAVKLASATRKARHTMGKKEKQKIRGTVVVPDEPAEPAATNGASGPTSNGAAQAH